jgi:hypothetical protein
VVKEEAREERGAEKSESAREIGWDSVNGSSARRSPRVGESTLVSRRGGKRRLFIPIDALLDEQEGGLTYMRDA